MPPCPLLGLNLTCLFSSEFNGKHEHEHISARDECNPTPILPKHENCHEIQYQCPWGIPFKLVSTQEPWMTFWCSNSSPKIGHQQLGPLGFSLCTCWTCEKKGTPPNLSKQHTHTDTSRAFQTYPRLACCSHDQEALAQAVTTSVPTREVRLVWSSWSCSASVRKHVASVDQLMFGLSIVPRKWLHHRRVQFSTMQSCRLCYALYTIYIHITIITISQLYIYIYIYHPL